MGYAKNIMSHPLTRLAFIAMVCAAVAFAQASPLGQAVQGAATEAVAVVKWVGIAIVCIAGSMIAFGGPGGVARVVGLVFGLGLALFAQPMVTWVQGL
jgi:hypothetical protein